MMFYTLKEFNFKHKRVLLRADFNVPLDEKSNITDDVKIRDAVPTIKYLLSKKCKLVIISHLGRPEGRIVEGLRLNNVDKILSKLLKRKVEKLEHVTGQAVEQRLKKMKNGEVVMLENVQFEPGEKNNDEAYARALASYCDYFVFDAFGQAHRDYASISGIQRFVPSCAGFLVEEEIENLSILEHADKPFAAIIGGDKSDKINVIEHLMDKIDAILVGGILANTFLKAKKVDIGKSKFDSESLESAKKLLESYSEKIKLPIDALIADKFDRKARAKNVKISQVKAKWMIVDIGKETIKKYKEILQKARTIVWAGPLGAFEIKKFESGTKQIALFLAKLKSVRIIGGGDSSAAVDKFKVAKKMTWVSSGGGATLDFIAGKELPGIIALQENYRRFRVR